MSELSTQIIINSSTIPGSNPANFEYRFSDPLNGADPNGQLNSVFMVALGEASIWYSWANISSDFNNQTFRYNNGTSWKVITIPVGTYQFTDINDYTQSEMKKNGDSGVDSNGEDIFYITLRPDYNQLRAQLIIANSYQLDLTAGKLNELLGFNSQIFSTNGTFTALSKANIENGVSNILIHCSIVGNSAFGGSYSSGNQSDIIWSYNPTVSPGELEVIRPNPLIFLPMKFALVQSIRMYITDEDGNILNLRDENTSYRLILKRI